MRVLAACSLGGAGHLMPLLPCLAAAERQGAETLVVGPPALAGMVEAAGHLFGAGGEPAEEQVALIRERLPHAPPDEASILANRDLFGHLAAAAMLPRMEHICADWRPDVILREPCEYASAIMAHRTGIPSAQVAISLAEAEDASITAAAPALEEQQKGLVEELRRAPYLTRFPASLDPSPFPSTIRYWDATMRSGGSLPDWWGGSNAPVVYVTFGTVLGYMPIAGAVYRAILDAVEGLEARVLLTVGQRFDSSSLGPVPSNVHVEAWVEQADVLGHAELVVCHGGSGTVSGALAAGVPMVVVPVFADQFENGRRVADARVGLLVEVERQPPEMPRRVVGETDVTEIARAIEAALADTSLRLRAGDLAREMAASPTVDEVLAAVLSGDSFRAP